MAIKTTYLLDMVIDYDRRDRILAVMVALPQNPDMKKTTTNNHIFVMAVHRTNFNLQNTFHIN